MIKTIEYINILCKLKAKRIQTNNNDKKKKYCKKSESNNIISPVKYFLPA